MQKKINVISLIPGLSCYKLSITDYLGFVFYSYFSKEWIYSMHNMIISCPVNTWNVTIFKNFIYPFFLANPTFAIKEIAFSKHSYVSIYESIFYIFNIVYAIEQVKFQRCYANASAQTLCIDNFIGRSFTKGVWKYNFACQV